MDIEKEAKRAMLLDLAGEIRLRMEGCPKDDLGRAERFGYEWVMDQISERISKLEKPQ